MVKEKLKTNYHFSRSHGFTNITIYAKKSFKIWDSNSCVEYEEIIDYETVYHDGECLQEVEQCLDLEQNGSGDLNSEDSNNCEMVCESFEQIPEQIVVGSHSGECIKWEKNFITKEYTFAELLDETELFIFH
jgi:bacterioferritin-associated ferredoxin